MPATEESGTYATTRRHRPTSIPSSLHIWEDHFQLHLSRDGRMDELTVHVERRTGVADADAASAGLRLSALVKNTIGVSVTTSVLAPDSVERSMGKMRRIVDQRPR